jgi:predicted O-methyltransferase YrrM
MKGSHISREQKNEKYKHISLEMETSTHFPLLMAFVQTTDGPILEVGTGVFSTPLLHWMCFAKKRKLISVERHKHYLEFAAKFKTDWHDVLCVKDLKEDTFKEHFSVVFIDHSPKKPRTRGDDALLFKDKADYVIIHDAGENGHKKYGYDQLYSQFKYRYDWNGCWPSTTVLSNTKDLSWLNSQF